MAFRLLDCRFRSFVCFVLAMLFGAVAFSGWLRAFSHHEPRLITNGFRIWRASTLMFAQALRTGAPKGLGNGDI
jgi:hypothetical protein